MGFWNDQRALVTGGSGFLGRHLVERLRKSGCRAILAPPRSEYDLRDPLAASRLYEDTRRRS